jgi:hypothetical protein
MACPQAEEHEIHDMPTFFSSRCVLMLEHSWIKLAPIGIIRTLGDSTLKDSARP